MLWTTLLMALREIGRNTMRSVLTGLGIVIGVSAVIGMVTLGQSATAKVTADVANLGNNMLTVMPGGQRRGPTPDTAPLFTLADAAAIRRQIPQAVAVAPTGTSSALAVKGNLNHSTTVYGSTLDFFVARGLTIAKGRLFSDAELGGGSPACIVGPTVVKELFGAAEALDQSIRIGKLNCTIVGVVASKGQSTFGQDQDDFLVMPLHTFQRRMAGNTDVSSIFVSASTADGTARVKQQVIALLRERRHIAAGQTDNFNVMDMKEFAAALGTITGALTALLGAIAAVSLLVGGIGIMNIMLVSVTERTREIGIRMAIGARASEVMTQFLVEAVMLSTMGGLLGMLLGVGGSWAATSALGMPFALSPMILAVAVGFSATVGIGFGYFPARKAARLNPIDALRHE